MSSIIFVTGVHGVGKGYYCSLIKDERFKHLTASSLIKKYNSDKKVKNIEENQKILMDSFFKLQKKEDKIFLFDGHFVLLDSRSKFQKIDIKVFKSLGISRVILLVDNCDLIYKRLKSRDTNTSLTVDILEKMQSLELEHTKYIAEELNIPLHILKIQGIYTEHRFIEILSTYM